MILTRRRFLKAATPLMLAAPAIVSAANIMRVRPILGIEAELFGRSPGIECLLEIQGLQSTLWLLTPPDHAWLTLDAPEMEG